MFEFETNEIKQKAYANLQLLDQLCETGAFFLLCNLFYMQPQYVQGQTLLMRETEQASPMTSSNGASALRGKMKLQPQFENLQ